MAEVNFLRPGVQVAVTVRQNGTMAPRILRLANPTSYVKIRTSLGVITTKGYAGFRDESPSRSMRKRLGYSYLNVMYR